jgi:CDP-diacylglycerol--inositol 3-phosphatidyltransferase
MFCFCNELFFVCLYLNASVRTPILSSAWVLSSPLIEYPNLAKFAASITWPQLIGLINFPLCFGKQIINVVQFWKASKVVSN